MTEDKGQPKGYKKAYKDAEKLSQDDSAFRRLMNSANYKSKAYKDRLKEVWKDTEVFLRMLKAWKSGEHKIELKTILSLLAAIIYFVNPFDIIPDMIPALGLIDDISIITYVVHRFENEIENFKKWEEENTQTQDE